MKILLIGNFTYPIYSPAFEVGFKALGHDVYCIKTEDYVYPRFFRFLNWVLRRFHMGIPLIKLNKAIIKFSCEIRPDLIFLYRCCGVKGKTVKRLREDSFCVYTYNNDDPFSGKPDKYYFRYFLDTICFANDNFVYRSKNVYDYITMGVKKPEILLPYYLKDSNYKVDCKDDIPIAFIGHYENDGRDKALMALKNAGLPISLYSGQKYWQASPFFDSIKSFMKPGVYGKDYNALLNRLQIALVFLSKINHDTYTRRCFEIPATCTLMLCEYTDDMNTLFPEDECACYFRSTDELIQKCQYLLSNPDEIKRIAINGYNRLKELGGTEVDRCRQIIDHYKKTNNNWI